LGSDHAARGGQRARDETRLNAAQIAMVLPVVVEQYPFYAPMIFTLYTTGFRYCHVAAMRESKLGADGVIAIASRTTCPRTCSARWTNERRHRR
jgi:hypothetical protein